jgi:hypothetical protein
VERRTTAFYAPAGFVEVERNDATLAALFVSGGIKPSI